jgi:hypothetical protein
VGVNSLALAARLRPGGAVSGDGQRSDRHFLEFVVDGEPLGRLLGSFLGLRDATDEYLSVLVTDWPTGIALDDLDHLLGITTSPELDGRTALYVCADCGDLGCGAVTAVVEVEDEKVVWRDIGDQNNYEPFDDNAVFTGAGPFVFDHANYTAALEQFRALATEIQDSDSDATAVGDALICRVLRGGGSGREGSDETVLTLARKADPELRADLVEHVHDA